VPSRQRKVARKLAAADSSAAVDLFMARLEHPANSHGKYDHADAGR